MIHARTLSEEGGVPLVILHGLLGSSRNWLSAGRDLGRNRTVLALDVPDHGDSEWTVDSSFAEMSGRIVAWADEQGLQKADWLGHSLGGKVAMRIASDRPDLVRRLVLADIFPRVYDPHHLSDLDAMLSLDLPSLPDRKAADRALAEAVPDWGLRQFLLTNLDRGAAGGFRWKANLEGLRRNLRHLAALSVEEGKLLRVPVLLVYGDRSDFVRPADLEVAGNFFADVRAVCLPEAGHNLHVEDREGFVRVVGAFLD